VSFRRSLTVLLAGVASVSLAPLVAVPSAAAESPSAITHDAQAKIIEITAGDVAVDIDYDHGVRIGSLELGGVETLDSAHPAVSELVIGAIANASYTYASDAVVQVIDGVVSYTEDPRNRWTAYRSPNASDWIEIDLTAVRELDGLAIDFFADAGAIKPPTGYRVEAWDGAAWSAVSGAQFSPAVPAGNATNYVRFDKVSASKFRVHFDHAGSYRTGVTEITPFSSVGAGAATASYTFSYDSVAQVVDGVVSYTEDPRNRWTAYRSPNASDWIEIDLTAVRELDGLAIDFFADAGAIKPPTGYRVEAWDGAAWSAVSGAQFSPAVPAGNATNYVRFDKVSASKFRVHFDHAGSYRTGVTEITPFSKFSVAQAVVAGTGELAASPIVQVATDSAVITGIAYGDSVEETWTFEVVGDSITLAIDRTFTAATSFTGQRFLGLAFREDAFDVVQRREDGGSLVLLDQDRETNRFLSAEPLPEHPTGSWFGNTQYAIYSTDVDLIDKANESVLSITVDTDSDKGVIFSRDPDPQSTRALRLDFAVADDLTHPSGKYLPLAVFQTERFSPISVAAGHRDRAEYTFSGSTPYSHYYGVAQIPAQTGVQADTLSAMLNDVLRSSVIDSHVGMGDTDVSGMGPYETWWYSQNAVALQAAGDAGYLDTLKNFVRFIVNENYPIHGTGQLWAVSARQTKWYKDDFFDTYGQYVAGVAAIYHTSGDEEWLREVAPRVRDSLDWSLARDSNGNGLIESFDVGISQWDDQTQHGQESAYANILMYKALLDWAELEETVFDDAGRAATLRDRAALIRATLNADVASGGFWSSATNSFVHTRDLAGNVLGDVAHVHDNATAVTFGVADHDRAVAIMAEYTAFQAANGLSLFPAQRLNFTGGENNNPFPSYLNGNIFPQMTLEMMSAYVTVGEDARALDLLAALAALYEEDELVYNTYNWDLSPDRRREPWFAANARPAAGFYTQLLGITPRADRLVLSPAADPRLNGVQLDYTTQGHEFAIEIVDAVTRRVASDGALPVELRWRNLEPASPHAVRVVDANGGVSEHEVVADQQGVVSFLVTAGSDSTYALAERATIDVDPPVVTVALPDPDASGWHRSAPAISVSATDESALDAVEYRSDGGSWQQYVAPVVLGDGVVAFEARARDESGNESEPVRRDIRVDTIAPTIELVDGPTGEVSEGFVPVAPTCSAADSGSGISGECTVTGYSTQVGVHTLEAVVSDLAGNSASATRLYTVAPAPEWDGTRVYTEGNVVGFDGSVWLASWWTRGQTPGDPYGPWQEVRIDAHGATVWTASRIFEEGDQVVFEGAAYEAQWWTRNQAPGVQHGPWMATD